MEAVKGDVAARDRILVAARAVKRGVDPRYLHTVRRCRGGDEAIRVVKIGLEYRQIVLSTIVAPRVCSPVMAHVGIVDVHRAYGGRARVSQRAQATQNFVPITLEL